MAALIRGRNTVILSCSGEHVDEGSKPDRPPIVWTTLNLRVPNSFGEWSDVIYCYDPVFVPDLIHSLVKSQDSQPGDINYGVGVFIALINVPSSSLCEFNHRTRRSGDFPRQLHVLTQQLDTWVTGQNSNEPFTPVEQGIFASSRFNDVKFLT
ncbi:hypothetical protein BDP55DRAFT_717298 [Colletotrichum godetiae]|uniref:Uncharacterized protein n=1 Tax=Colletotrichum godetiae TaxID=1209918 RepID=A0AAJ0AGF4_9PEZI|nr:uncharacterized protein BDP55DRAFT_717298 [Colletotrichum godetiae]KAK1673437.1 hypothetical protein BDP55DRAFT_717298 [Colletotrichum godetiae]